VDARAEPDGVTRVRAWVDQAQRVVVLTGAGISTDSGIPDFRGPQGVWTKNPEAEKTATLHHYLGDPEIRKRAWRTRAAATTWSAQPNAGHRAVAGLELRGKLHAVITQNVDGLHQMAGAPEHKVLEVHGTMWWTRCWECGDRRGMEETLERVRAGEEDPHCLVCGGILKSDTISFGQQLVPEVIEGAFTAAEEADLLIAAGSTLSVFPVANVVPHARANRARVVIVNAEPTAMDRHADEVLLGSLSEILPSILSARGPTV
jgi:NAD-dependent deacetylase